MRLSLFWFKSPHETWPNGFYYRNTATGEIIRKTSKTASAGEEYLYESSMRLDWPFTFEELYAKNYIALSLTEYRDEKVENYHFTATPMFDPENPQKGFKLDVQSNCRLQGLEINLSARTGGDLIFHKTVYKNPDVPYIYAMKLSDAELNEKLKTLPGGSYLLEVSTHSGPITEVGGEVPRQELYQISFDIQ